MDIEVKSQKGTTARIVAAILYSIFVIFQLLTIHAFVGKAAITGVSMLVLLQIGTAIGAGVFAVWLFGSKNFLTRELANKTIAATALIVIVDILFINDSADLINSSIGASFSFLANFTFVKFIAIAVRLVLLILAAFFVVYSLEGPDHVVLQAQEGEPEILADSEVEVVEDIQEAMQEDTEPEVVVEATEIVEEGTDEQDDNKNDAEKEEK